MVLAIPVAIAIVHLINNVRYKNQPKMFCTYEAWVRFETRVRVRVRDLAIFEKVSAIFEKGECKCGGTRQLKNYYLYF